MPKRDFNKVACKMPKFDFSKIACNFIKITFRHEFYPVNLLHTSRPPFSRNTPGWLLLQFNFYFLLFKLFVVRISFNNARFSTGMAG